MLQKENIAHTHILTIGQLTPLVFKHPAHLIYKNQIKRKEKYL